MNPILLPWAYAETNLFFSAILIFILYREQKNAGLRSENLYFRNVALCVLFILSADALWPFLNGVAGWFARILNYLLHMLHLFLAAVIGYLWLVYTEYKLKSRISARARLLLAVPLLFFFLLCVSTPWTKLLFTLDESNVFRRGNHPLIQIFFSYVYLLISGLRVIHVALHSKSRLRRTELLGLLSFSVLPFAGGIVTVFLPGLPLVWPLAAFSLLIIFINQQSYRISTDSLTGLKNRRQFDIYLFNLLSEQHSGVEIGLFLLDLNDFKSINDTYGHPEGDRALAYTARLLRNACAGQNAFLARYGGDEFAIILHSAPGKRDFDLLKKDILREFLLHGRPPKARYVLSVSIGFAACKANSGNAAGLVALADRALYEDKLRQKQDQNANRTEKQSAVR